VTGLKSTIEERHGKASMPCVVLTGAPQKAGERLGDDLFNLDGKAKTASATAYALPAKARERSGGAVAAGHFARAYVTGCKATIGECHGKTKAACHVSCRPALPAWARERLGDDLSSRDGKTKAAESLTVPTGAPGQNLPGRTSTNLGKAHSFKAPGVAQPMQNCNGFAEAALRPYLIMPTYHPQRMTRQPGRTLRG
jgi:hypothetical protein